MALSSRLARVPAVPLDFTLLPYRNFFWFSPVQMNGYLLRIRNWDKLRPGQCWEWEGDFYVQFNHPYFHNRPQPKITARTMFYSLAHGWYIDRWMYEGLICECDTPSPELKQFEMCCFKNYAYPGSKCGFPKCVNPNHVVMPAELPSAELLNVIADCMIHRSRKSWAKKHMFGDAEKIANHWIPLNLQDFQYGFRYTAYGFQEMPAEGLELNADMDLPKDLPKDYDMRAPEYLKRVAQEKKANSKERSLAWKRDRAKNPLSMTKKKRKAADTADKDKDAEKRPKVDAKAESRATAVLARPGRTLPGLRMGISTITRTTSEPAAPVICNPKSHKARPKPGKPPRVPTAYGFFVKENTAAVREEFKDKPIKQPEVIRILAERWKALADKTRYVAMHEAAKAARGGEQTEAKTEKPRRKAPKAPRAKRLAWNIFFQEKRAVTKLPEGLSSRAALAQLTQTLSQEWKAMSAEAKSVYKQMANEEYEEKQKRLAEEKEEKEEEEKEGKEISDANEDQLEAIRAGVAELVKVKVSTRSSLPTAELPLNAKGKYDFDDLVHKPRGFSCGPRRKLAQLVYYDSVAFPFICPVTQRKLTEIEAQLMCQLRWTVFSNPWPAPTKQHFYTSTLIEFVKLVRNYYGKQRAYGEKEAPLAWRVAIVQLMSRFFTSKNILMALCNCYGKPGKFDLVRAFLPWNSWMLSNEIGALLQVNIDARTTPTILPADEARQKCAELDREQQQQQRDNPSDDPDGDGDGDSMMQNVQFESLFVD